MTITRDEMRGALVNVLSNASNYPEKVQTRILGQDMAPLIDRAADALLPLIRRAQAEALREAANSGQAKMFSPAIYLGPERLRLAIGAREWLLREADRIENEGAGA